MHLHVPACCPRRADLHRCAGFNTVYNTNNTVELFGLPGKNYSIFETPVYDALLGANASLIYELQNMTQIVTDTVNGAVPDGIADTMYGRHPVHAWGLSTCWVAC